jgi:small subunit ribosomal protein S14
MKKQVLKDIQKRLKVFKEEKKRLLLKFIIRSTNLNKNLTKKAFTSLMFSNTLKGYRTQIKNRCIFTSRGRSIYSSLKISRITFRKLVSEGSLLGIRKSSW